MRKKHLMLPVAIVLIVALQSCAPQTEEVLIQWGEVMEALYRASGNSTVLLDGGDQHVGFAITLMRFTSAGELQHGPYPVNSTYDTAFFKEERIRERFDLDNLEQFTLRCGAYNASDLQGDLVPLSTNIVFWSGDYWEGSQTRFSCGGTHNNDDYEVTDGVSQVRSFCVVTEHTPWPRRDRCLNGPRCDDGMKNGYETDVDCGGNCGNCNVGQHCGSHSDCASNSCQGGICNQPTCFDGMKNQNETDIDCGGSCARCSNGSTCNSAGDCQSNYCSDGVCRPEPTCNGTPSTSSANDIGVFVEDIYQCGWVVTYFANSLADARGCAEGDGFTPVSQLCGYQLGIVGDNYYPYIEASSESHAFNCAAAVICLSCDFYVDTYYGCVSQ